MPWFDDGLRALSDPSKLWTGTPVLWVVRPGDDSMSSEKINHPPHYNQSHIEPIAVIDAWQLSFCLGNTVKYIARAPHKGSQLEDLKKAQWYLNHEIQSLEKLEKSK